MGCVSHDDRIRFSLDENRPMRSSNKHPIWRESILAEKRPRHIEMRIGFTIPSYRIVQVSASTRGWSDLRHGCVNHSRIGTLPLVKLASPCTELLPKSVRSIAKIHRDQAERAQAARSKPAGGKVHAQKAPRYAAKRRLSTTKFAFI